MKGCKICGSRNFSTAYEGQIRIGKFDNLSKEEFRIFRCQACGVIGLPNPIEDSAAYYESETYRNEVDSTTDPAHYYHLHDREQLRNLSVTGTAVFREKVVADIGCGAGSFLDAIRGYAKLPIAIEPSAAFRSAALSGKCQTYPYVKDAVLHHRGKVDIAVSFSVLEHVDDPLTFLREIRTLLASDGKLIVSTPNADDLLLEALPDCYASFFYRKAHLWYFDSGSLKKILEFAGYKNIRIVPHQRFGLANFLMWMKEKTPHGDLQRDFVTAAMDSVWRAELERTLRCDYLFAEAVHD